MAENTMPSGPGTFCWFELMTSDPGRSTEFYGSLFGWTTSTMQMGSQGTYTMFLRDGRPFAGMMPLEAVGPGTPPHWLSYIEVADVDAAFAKAKKLGGTGCVEPTDIPNIGRFAVLTDPAGAAFAIYKGTAS
jgi:predicted enzyme related to lactoylglutathione lyase